MFKTLSPGLQTLLLLFVVYFMAIVGEAFYGLSISAVVDQSVLENADWEDPRAILSHALFFQIFAFLIAFMFMLRLTRQRIDQVIMIQPLQIKPLLITAAFFVGGMLLMPFLDVINEPLKEILPSTILEREQSRNEINNMLVFHQDPVRFIFALLIMGCLPAICEELIFRGFLLRKMLESGLTKSASIVISAAIFSLTHFQPLKFLPIFFFGILLGYVYLRFKNIKYAMLLHFLINGSQIILGYLVGSEMVY